MYRKSSRTRYLDEDSPALATSRIVGTGVLDVSGHAVLVAVVVVIAALCMLTSRFGVYRILNTQH